MSINKTYTDIPFIHHEIIEEWDIRSANTSLMRYYKLVDDKIISKFENLKKEEREPKVGWYLKKHKGVSVSLEKAFTDIINEFISSNNLESENIVSIKKDSVFVRNKTIIKNLFGDDVTFVKKNKYSGCIFIPNYEFYYSPDKIDVKGISDSVLYLHQDGILAFISLFMQESNDWLQLNSFMKDYALGYKNRELTFNSYREFNSNSKFRVRMFGSEMMMDDIDEEILTDTDISFNYLNIYLPILKLIAR